jgi:hypothetical protein
MESGDENTVTGRILRTKVIAIESNTCRTILCTVILEHCVYSNVLFCVSAILPPGKLAELLELLDELEAELRSSCLEGGINLQFTQEGLTGTARLMCFINTFGRIMRTNGVYELATNKEHWIRAIVD